MAQGDQNLERMMGEMEVRRCAEAAAAWHSGRGSTVPSWASCQRSGPATMPRAGFPAACAVQDKGLKGSLYSRDDLLAKYGMPEGHEDDDEDADDPADFEGEPIDWHHIEGGKEPYTTRTVRRGCRGWSIVAAHAPGPVCRSHVSRRRSFLLLSKALTLCAAWRPALQNVQRVAVSAKEAAAAARDGVRSAAKKARSMWKKFQSGQKAKDKQEL